MRSTLPALFICLLSLFALGAHHADSLLTPVLPAQPTEQAAEDVYTSPAAARHRAAHAPHWGAMVLMPRQSDRLP